MVLKRYLLAGMVMVALCAAPTAVYASGSGYLLTSSGSLVGVHAACQHFTEDTPPSCDMWDYGVEIPMVLFFARMFMLVALTAVVFHISLCYVFRLLLIVIKWLYRLVTQRKP